MPHAALFRLSAASPCCGSRARALSATLEALYAQTITPTFHTLEDYLASTESSVDGILNDGWNTGFPVKGRELEATILFADITGFSTKTEHLSPTATLIFVQNFFAWVTAEALNGRPGIVDKYIGDEVMVVFSTEFGSEDPLEDAVEAAAAMSRHDVHNYQPHIGISSGPVVVGFAGTAFRYNVSVLGAPVALAARCAAVKPTASVSSTIVVPAAQWGDRPLRINGEDEHPRYSLRDPRDVEMKGLGQVAVREIYNTARRSGTPASQRAEAGLEELRKAGRYWPR